MCTIPPEFKGLSYPEDLRKFSDCIEVTKYFV